MTELHDDQLWYPGQDFSLTGEYPVPTQPALEALWADYLDSAADVEAVPGIYGAIARPDAPPSAFVSVDLCEVVRNTHTGLRKVEEAEAAELPDIHAYCHGLHICNTADITTVAQVLMHAGLIEPVDEITEITAVMRAWRRAGVYTFANTSTLPGCEPGTVRFLQEHMPGAFDGLLLPRNHDSLLPLTKGVAAATLIGQLTAGNAVEVVTLAHIDDKPCHNTAVWQALGAQPGYRVGTFQPRYPSTHAPDQYSTVVATPLAAFQAADRFLQA